MIERLDEQLSESVAFWKATTLLHSFAPRVKVVSLGHFSVLGFGFVTETRNEQVTLLLPPSLAENATVVVPTGNALPEARPEVRVTVIFEEQLSVSVGVAYVNILLHSVAASANEVSLAHLSIFGRIVSMIVTAVVH